MGNIRYNKKVSYNTGNVEYIKFIKTIRQKIAENNGKIGGQKEQFDLMYSLERKFQYHVCKSAQCEKVYMKFIIHVKKELGNILKAKGYFREKKDVFSKHISGAIKNDDAKELMKYQMNYNLVLFIVNNWKGELTKYSKHYFQELTDARAILIENNTPLALNRAKKFYSAQKYTDLELIDFVSICMHGLITGIDKFVGEYSRKLIGVSIGRMVGFMIKENSKTFLKMYPSDHKVLYRASSLRNRLKITQMNILKDAVIASFEEDKKNGRSVPSKKITEQYLNSLFNAIHSSSVLYSESEAESDNTINLYDMTPSNDLGTEEKVEKLDNYSKMNEAIKKIEIIERKVIKLKGVTLGG